MATWICALFKIKCRNYISSGLEEKYISCESYSGKTKTKQKDEFLFCIPIKILYIDSV